MATQHPCPTNVVHLAEARWKATPSRRQFFGHSHTAPGPKEYFLQKLGLSITKAFALHLRNASHKLGKRPPTSGAAACDDDSVLSMDQDQEEEMRRFSEEASH